MIFKSIKYVKSDIIDIFDIIYGYIKFTKKFNIFYNIIQTNTQFNLKLFKPKKWAVHQVNHKDQKKTLFQKFNHHK